MASDSQALLIKVHAYRTAGILFLVLGVLMFAVVYTNLADGDFMRLFEKPSLIIWLISPFLPASLMFWLCGRQEKKLSQLLEQSDKSA